jgi:hypothetical protein
MPLFRAATAFIAARPGEFPIRQNVGIVVTSADPLPTGDGYGAADPMIEVLVDAGLVADERLVAWERYDVAPDATGYALLIMSEDA